MDDDLATLVFRERTYSYESHPEKYLQIPIDGTTSIYLHIRL